MKTVQQFFGPSARYDRPCVELRFPMTEARYRLAPHEPLLRQAGLELREPLSDEALALDAAVSRLTSVLLGKHAAWWSLHGCAEGNGWAAIEFPVPSIAAQAISAAHGLLTAGPTVPARSRIMLHNIAQWMSGVSKYRMWALGVAQALGRDAITLVGTSEVYQVGHGAKGVHGYRLGTERDAITGQKLEEVKIATVQVLERLGLPTTTAVLVQGPEGVADAISRVGLPCVVKPLNLLRGEGVAPGLTSEAAAIEAVKRAQRHTKLPVQIENHVEGDNHRMFVVAHELLWAYRRTPTSVVGDGTATVGDLIERENERRAATRAGDSDGYLQQVKVDEALHRLLADRHGLAFDSVLEAGRSVQVVAQANIMQGGLQEDVTGEVHPDNRALVTKVSRLFRLRSIGIDFITPDISRSWKEVPCAIIEVNRLPGCEGFGDVMFAHRTLFPNRRSGWIPTVVAVGDARYRAAAGERALAAFAGRGLRAARTDSPAHHANAELVTPTPGAPGVEAMLLDPDLDAAIVLCGPEEIERAGLPLRRCDVLLRQDEGPLSWLENAAETVLRGTIAPEELDTAVARLARRYRDPAEGGPLPVLEAIEGAPNEFRLKVWRARGMPRAWFWQQAGTKRRRTNGLTTHEDLLAAVVAIAKQAGTTPRAGFVHDEPIGPWARVTFEASLALPRDRAEEARAALCAAVARVNEIAALKID